MRHSGKARGRGELKQVTTRTRVDDYEACPMTNLLKQAINCDDGDRAAKIIRDALGIENDDVTNYTFSKDWLDTA